mgnify:FL=1
MKLAPFHPRIGELTVSTTQSPWQKREDFPVDTFRHLEGLLQILRRKIMAEAAEIAKRESPPEEEIFVVKREHVEAVIESMGLSRILSL